MSFAPSTSPRPKSRPTSTAGSRSQLEASRSLPGAGNSGGDIRRAAANNRIVDLQSLTKDVMSGTSKPKTPNRNANTTPRAPDQPAAPQPNRRANPNLPADQVQASRGERRSNYSLLDGMQNAGRDRNATRGSVLSSVYRLPMDGSRAARTLQSFNGKQGERLALGR